VAVGSGLLVIVPFVKPVLDLDLLVKQSLLHLLPLFCGNKLRQLQRRQHRKLLLPRFRRPLLRGRIDLLLRSRLKLLGRLPEPPRLGEFAIPVGKLPAKALRLGLATATLRGGGYIAIFFALPFFLAIIAAGISFIAIGFLAFIAIGIFFDFAKVKLLATVFGVRYIGHSVSPRSCAPGGDSASGPAL
jgi:hypothetical protein